MPDFPSETALAVPTTEDTAPHPSMHRPPLADRVSGARALRVSQRDLHVLRPRAEGATVASGGR